MKVAITSRGPDMASEIDQRFGRAKYFIVVDTDSGEFTAHHNAQNVTAIQGAGIQAARNVVGLGVDAVITGNVGPKAFTALQNGNVNAYIGATGSVSDTVKRFTAGELERIINPTVAGHWV
jgi:predicted Fe-Mo cluster-binding NifX family protein